MQVITIICNLVLLLYFGGEVQDTRRNAPDEGYGGSSGKQPLSSAELQMSGSVPGVTGISSSPAFRSGEPPLADNPFAHPV
jgi:hypothetical protein